MHFPGFSQKGLSIKPVLTTKDVPRQALPCNPATLKFLLPVICNHLIDRNLPNELVEIIIQFTEFVGITREAAERHRLSVIEERTLDYENLESV